MNLNYIVLGTNNLESTVKFYDSLFKQTEVKRITTTDRMTFWQCEDFAFAVATPFDEEHATNGNGTMIGFDVGSIEEVKRFHKKVINLGGSCEGKPNHRGPRFSAYARDPNNNKLCFYM